MELLKVPNSILKQRAEAVTDIESVKALFPEMVGIIVQNGLVGLAGNQVGILRRIFVMRCGEEYVPIINPKIIPDKTKGEKWGWESCGSIPNMAFLVKRWAKIELKYTSLDGNILSLDLIGESAIIAQHEADHLNDILIADKARQRKVLR